MPTRFLVLVKYNLNEPKMLIYVKLFQQWSRIEGERVAEAFLQINAAFCSDKMTRSCAMGIDEIERAGGFRSKKGSQLLT